MCVPSLLNLPPVSYPISPLQVVTEPQCELPVSYSKFPLAIYFTLGSVYVSMLLSPCLTHNESSVNTTTIVFLAQGIKGGFQKKRHLGWTLKGGWD